LHNSAFIRCPLCRMFLGRFQPFASQPHNHLWSNITIDAGKNQLFYKFYGFPEQVFELFTPKARDLIPLFLGLGVGIIKLRDIQQHPDSDACYQMIQNWLNACISTHIRCMQTNFTSLPTRLLDVSGQKLCLRHSRDIRQKSSRYAIFSNCWGLQKSLETTKANLISFERGLKPNRLPQALLDAVKVTRRLKLRYLWVDSLCILQDLIKDWEAECIRMGDYYCSSYVMISALDSPDSYHGFLKTRPRVPSTLF